MCVCVCANVQNRRLPPAKMTTKMHSSSIVYICVAARNTMKLFNVSHSFQLHRFHAVAKRIIFVSNCKCIAYYLCQGIRIFVSLKCCSKRKCFAHLKQKKRNPSKYIHRLDWRPHMVVAKHRLIYKFYLTNMSLWGNLRRDFVCTIKMMAIILS